jgi:hypothetical protein
MKINENKFGITKSFTISLQHRNNEVTEIKTQF